MCFIIYWYWLVVEYQVLFLRCGDPTPSSGDVKVALSEVADLQSMKHSDSPALAFSVVMCHLVIELIMSRCAALSLLVSVNSGIPASH